LHWNKLNFLELSQRALCIIRQHESGISLTTLTQLLWREPEACLKVLNLLLHDGIIEVKVVAYENIYSITPGSLGEVDQKLHSAFIEHAALGELYFAYGSNLNPQRMEKRGVKPRFIARAKAHNYSLTFLNTGKDQPGVAGLLNHSGAENEGVLYLVTDEELATLDFFERVPSAYIRYPCQISVTLGNNGRIYIPRLSVITYQSLYQTPSPPEKAYLDHLLKGAQFWGFSSNSITFLENHPTFTPKQALSDKTRTNSRSRQRRV
jgi:hypothetical protein